MTHTEIVKKLIGEITPIGETNTDNERFENLKAMCRLVNDLVVEIDNVAINLNRPEYSIKRAAEYAEKFLCKDLGIQ